MSTSPEQLPSPRVRDLTRWRIPFHYAPSIAVAAIGIGMLLAGGVIGGFGGWVLAVALPIAIGGFLRSPWFALAPIAVWAGWLVHVGNAAPDATLSNTPFEVALVLATIGAGATLLAQRAIFPATEPIAWKASTGRVVPPLDDGATPPLDDVDEDALDDEVADGLEVTEDELAEATLAAEAKGAAAADEAADKADADDAKVAAAEQDADDDAAVTKIDLVKSDAAAGAEANDEDETDADVELSDDDDVEPAAEDSDAEDADGDAPAETDPARVVAESELPLDADPASLDEGGHVTEFTAISESDLESTADEHHVREPAHADSEAGRR